MGLPATTHEKVFSLYYFPPFSVVLSTFSAILCRYQHPFISLETPFVQEVKVLATMRSSFSRSFRGFPRLQQQRIIRSNITPPGKQQYRYLCASDRPDQVHNYLHKDRWQFAKIHQLFHAFGNNTEASPGLSPTVQGHHITHLNQSCSVTVHDWGPTAYYLNGVMQPFSPANQPGDIPLYEEQAARPWYCLSHSPHLPHHPLLLTHTHSYMKNKQQDNISLSLTILPPHTPDPQRPYQYQLTPYHPSPTLTLTPYTQLTHHYLSLSQV